MQNYFLKGLFVIRRLPAAHLPSLRDGLVDVAANVCRPDFRVEARFDQHAAYPFVDTGENQADAFRF